MTDAVLLRNVPLVVRDVSSGGCLIESGAPLQVGTVGWLEVEFEGERRFEWFRIARVHMPGGRACGAGVEFLPLAAAGADSLRSAIGRLQAASVSGSPKATGRSSGDSENSGADVIGAETGSSSRAADPAGKIVKFARPASAAHDGNSVAQSTDVSARRVRLEDVGETR
jgi:hypothetical protein